MIWKKNKCPECKGKLTNFGVNMDTQRIECVKCRAQFNPLQVFRDSDIILLSRSLPPEKQEKFLTDLGFERKTIHRTQKWLLYCFIIFLILGSSFCSVIFALTGFGITSVSPFIGGILLCYGIYCNYRNEEKPKWHRKKLEK